MWVKNLPATAFKRPLARRTMPPSIMPIELGNGTGLGATISHDPERIPLMLPVVVPQYTSPVDPMGVSPLPRWSNIDPANGSFEGICSKGSVPMSLPI